MTTPQCIEDGFKKYQTAEKGLTEYMKYVSNFNIEKANKIEKLRDQLKKII